jgi:hypothetical protein
LLGTGRLIVDVQGEDDSLILEYVRKPAIVQRVINGQINALVGGGTAEPIPSELRQHDLRRSAPDPPGPHPGDTPPLGTPVVGAEPEPKAQPQAPPPTSTGAPAGASHADIRDRLIELDDLRRRGIISEEEFAAKKAELLNRI